MMDNMYKYKMGGMGGMGGKDEMYKMDDMDEMYKMDEMGNGYDTKKKLLEDMMAWADHGRAQDLKLKYASQPSILAPQEEAHVEYMGADGEPVDKASIMGPDGMPAESPALLLADLNDEDIRKLLGG